MKRPMTGRTDGPSGRPRGSSFWYQAPAGVKLLSMLAFGVLVIAFRSQWTGTAALVIALSIALWARVPLRVLWHGIRPLAPVIVILALIQGWQRGFPLALELVSTTLALVIAAIVVTAITPADETLDAIAAAFKPARKIGANPDRIALSFSLMITAIENIASIARQTRQAAKARGLERNPRAQLTPLVIRTIGHAHATGEALTARGIGDETTGGDQ